VENFLPYAKRNRWKGNPGSNDVVALRIRVPLNCFAWSCRQSGEEEKADAYCTDAYENAAQPLLDIIAENNLEMILPRGLYTLEHKANREVRTRPDNVFCSEGMSSELIKCEVNYEEQGPGADHFPIVTIFQAEIKYEREAIRTKSEFETEVDNLVKDHIQRGGGLRNSAKRGQPIGKR